MGGGPPQVRERSWWVRDLCVCVCIFVATEWFVLLAPREGVAFKRSMSGSFSFFFDFSITSLRDLCECVCFVATEWFYVCLPRVKALRSRIPSLGSFISFLFYFLIINLFWDSEEKLRLIPESVARSSPGRRVEAVFKAQRWEDTC